MRHALKAFFGSLFGPARSRAATGRRPVRLRLKMLENRLVPAALTYTVTTVLDNNVAHPGLMSLRDAVIAANANADPGDVINFAGSLAGKTIKLAQGELDITASVKIQGPGAGRLAVSGQNNSRIFSLLGGSTAPDDVTIAGLTLENGNYQTRDNPEVDGGGAIGAVDFGSNFFGPASVDSLTVQNCVLTGNKTNGVGGAIQVTGGSLTIQHTTLSSNVSGHEGGAIAFDDAGNDVTLRIDQSTLSDNRTTGEQGGGLSIQGGKATISGCTFVGNVAGNEGGAISSRPTGTEFPVPTNSPNTVIQNTTIYGNKALNGNGGGVWAAAGTLTLLNDTIDQNQAPHGAGGGVFNDSGMAKIYNTIVAANQELSAVAGNHLQANDLGGTGGTYDVLFSLVQAVSPGTINGTNSHNLLFVSPRLGPLGNHGGPTLTQELAATSPALGAGSASLLAGLTVDQIGSPRPAKGAVDMGAVESSRLFRWLW